MIRFNGEELAPWERVLGAIPLLNDAGKLIELGDALRRSIALATDASRAAEAAGDRRKALEVAESIGEGLAASERRLEAAQATGDADLIAEAQADVSAAQAAYQDALAAAERACFVAGTLILTPTGLRAIEELQVGETVLAGNPDTGVVKECRILQTFVHQVSQVFEVQVGNETIGCSAEHPFWVVDRGWTHANKLQVGDALVTSAGEVVTVIGVQSQLEKVTVYNFEVEHLHTYFVSNLGILVHNTDCGENPFDISVLSSAAGQLDRGGALTKAGRALQKHSGRPGSAFPRPTGNEGVFNSQGQQIVDDILNNPDSTFTQRSTGRFGEVVDVVAPDGRGVRYTTNGEFIGFLEP